MEITNLKPLNGNILVVDAPQKEKTDGGIFIPQTQQETILEGTVLKVSSYTTKEGVTISPETKENDTVIYRNVAGAGNTWRIDDKLYRIIKPIEMLAVIEQ